MDFTVKTMSQLRDEVRRLNSEKNFLSTILYSNRFMSGSAPLYRSFMDLIASAMSEDEQGVPARNWQQFLGDTDKGSILMVHRLKIVEDVVGAAARVGHARPLPRANARTLHLIPLRSLRVV